MKLKTILIALLLLPSVSLAEAKLGKREIVLNNDFVEVVRLTYPAGTESGFYTHQHPHRVVYVVKGGKIELVPEGSQGENPSSQVIEVTDGQALFLPPLTQNLRNIGDTEIVLVETEIKGRE